MNPTYVGIGLFIGTCLFHLYLRSVQKARQDGWEARMLQELDERKAELSGEVKTLKGDLDRRRDQFGEEVQEVYKALSANNDMNTNRFNAFYKEFTALRIKLAWKLKINGDD